MSQYMTPDHEPPNGAIPGDRIMATFQAQNEPKSEDHGPPNGGIPQGRPPAYTPYVPSMSYIAPSQIALAVPIPMFPTPSYPWPSAMPVAQRVPIAAGPQPLPQAQARSPYSPIPYEPPGQFGPGTRMHEAEGASYIFPSLHTTIHFVGDGVRPCDYDYYPHQFRYSKHHVPSDMTIRELMRKLGCPPRAENGVSEMVYLGETRWGLRATHTIGDWRSGQSIASVNWNSQRGGGNPVWLVVKR